MREHSGIHQLNDRKRNVNVINFWSCITKQQEIKNGHYKKNIEVIQGDWTKTFHVKKTVDNLVLPHDTEGVILRFKNVYDEIPLNSNLDFENIIQY